MLSHIRIFVLFISLIVPLTAQSATVVVTIPPLAAAIKPLLDESDKLVTLLPKGQSPHHFQLKPSHLMEINRADIVLSIGGGVDQWAQKAITNTDGVIHIRMSELPGLVLLPVRGAHTHEHEHGESHNKKGFDPHLWLSAENIEIMIKAFSKKFQERFPQKSQSMQQKEADWLVQIQQTDAMTSQQLQPVQKVPYLVMHDAFQYFEQRYQLNHAGAIQPSSGASASLKKIMEVHELIQDKKVKCIFKEPQLSEKQLKLLIENTDVKIGNLDPLGEADQDYTELMQNLARQFLACLES